MTRSPLRQSKGDCGTTTGSEKEMSEGTIKKLTDRGFGFIRTSGGQDLFFHMSSVEGATFEQLQEGQKVEYVEGQGQKGPRAESVRPL
jgi:CspA family cold shock protein